MEVSSRTGGAVDSESRILGVFLFVSAAFALSVWISWTGFLGSDDANYAAAARHWLQEGPFVGGTHFALRLTAVLPIAASFKLFGVREMALILPTLLCGAVVTAIFSVIACRVSGILQGLFAIVLFVTVPLVASANSTAGVDLVELAFDLASVCLFLVSIEKPHYRSLLFLCGMCVGFGFISRETSIFLLATYGLLFFAGFGLDRKEYGWIAAGFLVVAGGEMLVYYFVTGNPLYRLNVDFHHDLVDRNASNGPFDQVGNLHVGGVQGAVLNPLLMLFFNKNFGVLFWLAIPAAIWFFRVAALPSTTKIALRITGVACLVWMAGAFVLFGKLYLVPRYMLFPACMVSLLVGAWMGDLLRRSRALALGIGTLALVANLTGTWLDDHNFMFPERELVSYVRSTNRQIFTDRETYRRSLFLLESEGLEARVTDRQHKLGDIFFFVPDNAGVQARMTGHEPAQNRISVNYAPMSGERIIACFRKPERWLAHALTTVGLARWIPNPLMQKLRGSPRTILVYTASSSMRGHPPA